MVLFIKYFWPIDETLLHTAFFAWHGNGCHVVFIISPTKGLNSSNLKEIEEYWFIKLMLHTHRIALGMQTLPNKICFKEYTLHKFHHMLVLPPDQFPRKHPKIKRHY